MNAGISQERDRIKNIQELAIPGQETLVNDALYVTPVNAGEFAINQTKAQMALKNTTLKGINNDAGELGEITPPDDNVVVEKVEFENDVNDMVNMMG